MAAETNDIVKMIEQGQEAAAKRMKILVPIKRRYPEYFTTKRSEISDLLKKSDITAEELEVLKYEIPLIKAGLERERLHGLRVLGKLHDEPKPQPKTDTQPKCTADDAARTLKRLYIDNVQAAGGEFIDDVESVLFADIGRFMYDSKTNRSVAIVIHGGVGRGKSTLLAAVADYIDSCGRPKVIRVTAMELIDYYKNDKDRFAKCRDCLLLSIDDLGTEPPKVFLDRPLVELLEHRLTQPRKGTRKFTFITTMLNRVDLRDVYGERVVQRLVAMGVIVNIHGGVSYWERRQL